MPWNERSAMDERIRFIADYLDDLFPFTELCLRYDISRPTGYKWVQRCIEGGAAGLMDRSRRPNRCPHATSSELIEAILEARHRHPTWGAKKLLTRLTRAQPIKPGPRAPLSATSSNDRASCPPGGHTPDLDIPVNPRPP